MKVPWALEIALHPNGYKATATPKVAARRGTKAPTGV